MEEVMVEAKRRAGVFLKETNMVSAWGHLGDELDQANEMLCDDARALACLGMAVVMRCDPCIEYWLDEVVNLGVDEAKVRDILRLAIKMGGGPGLMYAAKALEMYKGMINGRNA
jgi:alkylhydroperoxidase/carboxymuconolactone decarboxylase family protein YurZ